MKLIAQNPVNFFLKTSLSEEAAVVVGGRRGDLPVCAVIVCPFRNNDSWPSPIIWADHTCDRFRLYCVNIDPQIYRLLSLVQNTSASASWHNIRHSLHLNHWQNALDNFVSGFFFKAFVKIYQLLFNVSQPSHSRPCRLQCSIFHCKITKFKL